MRFKKEHFTNQVMKTCYKKPKAFHYLQIITPFIVENDKGIFFGEELDYLVRDKEGNLHLYKKSDFEDEFDF